MAACQPLFFPEDWPAGPWGVNSIRNAWYVCHAHTGRAKRIGRVGARGRINYFDRAIEEATRLNEKEQQK
jgi:hypothetical protein